MRFLQHSNFRLSKNHSHLYKFYDCVYIYIVSSNYRTLGVSVCHHKTRVYVGIGLQSVFISQKLSCGLYAVFYCCATACTGLKFYHYSAANSLFAESQNPSTAIHAYTLLWCRAVDYSNPLCITLITDYRYYFL